jgi:hypothetical protein
MNEVLSAKMQLFANLRGNEEAIRYSLYHHKDLAAGALRGPYSYFTIPVGQQDPDTGAAATEEDTNMDAGGLLTAPNRFMVTKICVPIVAITTNTIPVGSDVVGTAVSFKDDVARLVMRGLFTFRLLNKEYLRLSPLGLIGAGMGVWGSVAAATAAAGPVITNAIVSNGAPSCHEGYRVILPLETQTTFVAQIGFPKAGITTTANLRVGVVLHGVLYRPEQ